MYTTLITSSELAEHLADPIYALIDCRFDLSRPDWGFLNYQESHIPGAVYAHLNQNLSSPVTPETGRHPLPEIEDFLQQLSDWGISQNTQVVVYDTTGGSFAARLWFMLRLVGHKAVAVLDGGFGTWLSEKRPVQSGIESRTPARFPTPIDIHYNWIVSAEEVNLLRQNSDILLLDARAPERFKGEVEPIDTVAGHIPGAVNRFHGANISADGKMKSSEILRSEFKNILGSIPPSKVVVYCGSGVTSCHHLLAMENAGLKGARIYIGSWSEWIRNPDHPIAKS